MLPQVVIALAEPKELVLAPVQRPRRQTHLLLAFRDGNREQYTALILLVRM